MDQKEFDTFLEIISELLTYNSISDEEFVFISVSQQSLQAEDGRFVKAEYMQPLLTNLGYNMNKQFIVNELKNLPEIIQKQAFINLLSKINKQEQSTFLQKI